MNFFISRLKTRLLGVHQSAQPPLPTPPAGSMLYVLALNVHTYCMLYLVIVLSCVASVCYKQVFGTYLYEHHYCTVRDILFHYLMTNVLNASHFGWKSLLNALNVNVNVFLIPPPVGNHGVF